ncbi:MAG: hypothetical protein WBE34_12075, partial [Candidatus Nitrosopolaris sp.]
DNNGAITYHGVMFFSSNSTGKLAFLNNLEGLYITEVNDSKQNKNVGVQIKVSRIFLTAL